MGTADRIHIASLELKVKGYEETIRLLMQENARLRQNKTDETFKQFSLYNNLEDELGEDLDEESNHSFGWGFSDYDRDDEEESDFSFGGDQESPDPDVGW